MGNHIVEILNRKGARKVQEVPSDVLKLINHGEIETVNLVEWLAVDHTKLIRAVFPGFKMDSAKIDQISRNIKSLKKPTAMAVTKLVGSTLYEMHSGTKNLESLFSKLSAHPSDSVRCYAPYLIAPGENGSIQKKLEAIAGLAADKHFGVREVVWMALRPEIEKTLEDSIGILSRWAMSPDENLRRFASESTRPRGVWCKHLDRLKEEPEMALPLLENLRSDRSKYVRDSVGNWLNDASKTRPDFVAKLCKRWEKESPTKETAYIIRRGMRNMAK